MTIRLIFEVKKQESTACFPPTNDQAELYSRILVARLLHSTSEHQKDWATYIQLLTYKYNTQTHRGTEKSHLTFSYRVNHHLQLHFTD